MSVFTKAKNFNVSNVSYGTPKVSDRGNKTISLLYNGAPLVLQFPLMLTWGLNERVDDNSGRVSTPSRIFASSLFHPDIPV